MDKQDESMEKEITVAGKSVKKGVNIWCQKVAKCI